MKDSRLILEPAKGALIACGVCLALVIATITGLSHYKRSQTMLYAQHQAELQAMQSEIETLSADLDSLETHLAKFRRLASVGLIGEPERDLWVQGFEAIAKRLKLPPTLRYSLTAPKQLGEEPQAASGLLPPAQPNALRHDLDFELSGLHEEEFLEFIGTLRREWQTPFRLETCQMSRDPGVGVQVKCTLRLFSLPLPKG